MEFFIDTANVDEIKAANELGVLAGVTTNPTLVAKEGIDFHERLKEITSIVSKSVSAEVIAEDAEGMIKEGKELAKIAPNITVKIQMTLEGLKAVIALSELNIQTNVTLIFNANQVLLAARAGSSYVSPFLGRIDDIGQDGMQLIAIISEIFDRFEIESIIISASIRHPLHVKAAALHGDRLINIPYYVYAHYLNIPSRICNS